MPRKGVGEMKEKSLLRGVSQFTPSDELDVLLAKELAKFLAGEEIEIALTPGSAPGVALASGGYHFVVCEGQVDDEFGDAGLKIFERGLVEIGPLFRGNGGRDCDGMI